MVKPGSIRAMTNAEIRRENARWLAKQCGGQTRFAELLDMEGPQVSHIIGRTPKKNIGNQIARRIEQAFSKEPGWLDIPDAWSLEARKAAPQGQHEESRRIDAEDAARLIILFSGCTEEGRRQIMRMAESAERLP